MCHTHTINVPYKYSTKVKKRVKNNTRNSKCRICYYVGKLFALDQPTRPTQPSIHPGSVNE